MIVYNQIQSYKFKMPKDFILDHFLSAADRALAKKFKDESDIKRILYSLSNHAALYASKVLFHMFSHDLLTACFKINSD